MNPSPTDKKIKYVGLDVHAETIAVAIADASGEVRSYGNIPAHSHGVDRLHGKLTAEGATVHYVYEAGPTGFWLCRHLRRLNIFCQIVSPSLIPKRASDRVKTDRRDALTLARLLRAGELSFIAVPDEADEAIRDLVRTRLRAVEDLRRCRQRIKGFLLRYGRRYSGKSSWTDAHRNYLSLQKFNFPGQQMAFEELVNAAEDPAKRLERLTQAIQTQVKAWTRLPLLKALMCLRGIGEINAVTWVCEVGDIGRFAHPSQLMSFIGITPSEDSSGQRRRQGSITKAGHDACRRAIVEAAWQYRLPARITPTIRQRQHGQPKAITDLAWKAQVRLCGRYQALIQKHKSPVVVVTAVGRELVGFIWAIAREVSGAPAPVREPRSTPSSAPRRALESASRRGARLDSNAKAAPAPSSRKVREYVLDPNKTFQPKGQTRK